MSFMYMQEENTVQSIRRNHEEQLTVEIKEKMDACLKLNGAKLKLEK